MKRASSSKQQVHKREMEEMEERVGGEGSALWDMSNTTPLERCMACMKSSRKSAPS